ncbi:MAG: Myb-like DNA-binding domain-containing protein [Cyclobacteriaceae bacterium]|nr:Myb-like DNA-binding domain-containing protein [Cyclobacteriaceae bacterium]
MARPKKHILKAKVVSVHMTRSDQLVLKGLAKKCKLSISEYLLHAGLQIELKAKFSDEEIELFRQLVALGNNINQIAKHINTGKNITNEALGDLEKFSLIINKFK